MTDALDRKCRRTTENDPECDVTDDAVDIPSALTPDQIYSVYDRCGVRNIFETLFGAYHGTWSPFNEKDWLYHDGCHFNRLGQFEIRRRFSKWLMEEVRRDEKFDVLIADSFFLTHDDSFADGCVTDDHAEMRKMGFSWTHMRCGIGFVRNGGFANMIASAISSGELDIAENARVLLVTSGNDVWCCPHTQPLYTESWLQGHIEWVREVLAPFTKHVQMVSILDKHFDWGAM